VPDLKRGSRNRRRWTLRRSDPAAFSTRLSVSGNYLTRDLLGGSRAAVDAHGALGLVGAAVRLSGVHGCGTGAVRGVGASVGFGAATATGALLEKIYHRWGSSSKEAPIEYSQPRHNTVGTSGTRNIVPHRTHTSDRANPYPLHEFAFDPPDPS
jgi:hypothetical protein